MELFHRVVAAEGEAGGQGGPQPAPQKRLPQSAPTPRRSAEAPPPARPCKTLHSTSLHLPALARLLSARFPPASGRVPSPTSGL